MSNFLKRAAHGAAVPHEKRTSNLETVVMPLPSKIVLSMSQHIGAPAAPTVKKGDQVYVGTVVGKAGGFVSSDIHSGVSGKVDGITTIIGSNGSKQTAVVIIPDGEQTETYTYTDENGEEQTETYTYTNYRTALYSLNLDSQVCTEVQGLTLPSVEEGWEGSSYVNNFQVMDDGSIWIFCMVNQYKTELPDGV